MRSECVRAEQRNVLVYSVVFYRYVVIFDCVPLLIGYLRYIDTPKTY